MSDRTFRVPTAAPTTSDEHLVKSLYTNDRGYNYPTYPVDILEKRCRRWAKAKRLTPGAGNTAASFCKRARKNVLQAVSKGRSAEEALPTRFSAKEQQLFSIDSDFIEQLYEIVLDHIQLCQETEDRFKDFVIADAPLNSF